MRAEVSEWHPHPRVGTRCRPALQSLASKGRTPPCFHDARLWDWGALERRPLPAKCFSEPSGPPRGPPAASASVSLSAGGETAAQRRHRVPESQGWRGARRPAEQNTGLRCPQTLPAPLAPQTATPSPFSQTEASREDKRMGGHEGLDEWATLRRRTGRGRSAV